jgi:protein AFG1
MPRALSKVYFHPISPENTQEFDKLFAGLTANEEVLTTRDLTVWGRKVRIPKSTARVARFTFKELCGGHFSASDYLEMTRNFETIFVDAIPELTQSDRDLVRFNCLRLVC